MPTAPLDPSFPLHITLLCCIAAGARVVIIFLLILINSKFSALSAKLTRSTRATKIEHQDASPNLVEAATGTHFEEFLNEEPERRKLAKNEQFKAYRAWRSEKGLNWSK
jgi:hypothetical protein